MLRSYSSAHDRSCNARAHDQCTTQSLTHHCCSHATDKCAACSRACSSKFRLLAKPRRNLTANSTPALTWVETCGKCDA